MPPQIATLLFFVGTIGLIALDRDRGARISPALLLPVAWLSIGGSRNVTVWLGTGAAASPELYLDGSPLDRALLTGLIVAGVLVLAVRRERTGEVLRRNAPLLLFFLYCAASALWSDFPFVAFKRWTKVLGNVVMVLVVLTELDPAAALKKFLTWTAYLLIPASVLIVKYYPQMGRMYDRWDGTVSYTGVTTDKNLLGCTCLVCGLGIVLRFIDTWREPTDRARRLLAVGTVLGMNLWLFNIAHSATSLGCFLVGSMVMVVLGVFRQPKPWVVHVMVTTLIIVGAVSYAFPSAFAFIVQSAGRNTTLTGRTELWGDVLSLEPRPWFGAGFESYFLGSRLDFLWRKYWWHPNEAHNGYLETYLTLGIVGLCLLGMLLVTGYRNALRAYRRSPSDGSLRLAFVVVAVIYNLTEAAFKVMNPVWILFLLAVTAAPDSTDLERERKDSVPAPRKFDTPRPFVMPTAPGAAGRRLPPAAGRPAAQHG